MKKYLFLILLFYCYQNAITQTSKNSMWGFSNKLPNRIEIPFDYINNLIVVNVDFHRIFPLKFVFDTGAEHTILARKEITDVLGMPYLREFELIGADMSQNLKAHLVRGVSFQIGPRMFLPYHSILVLEDDYFRFEEVTGHKIHGIIGADIFKNFVVSINFQRQIITLTKPSSFKRPGREFKAFPIEILKNRPYIYCPIKINNDSLITAKLLIDTGATIAIILNTNTSLDLKLPPDLITGNIGIGLGGFLEGFLGRIEKIGLGDFEMNEVISNFQELPAHVDTSLLNDRNGILGNQILRRFNIIIDYRNQILYLKPNRDYKKKFKYDKSGIIVIVAGMQLNRFMVHDILNYSPAFHAGLKKGDELKSINRMPISFYSLQDINKIFSKKEGKKIRLVIKRNGKRMVINFKLQKLI
ncbi:MAG: aspartyl protease family protein [Bacteroidetes bacterium]|nr:aspartyl protease family protein [Bacteroidota bacterium]